MYSCSSDTNIFPDENLKSFVTKGTSIKTPFNDSDHLVSIDPKYHGINDFNKLNINKNSSLATFHLNIHWCNLTLARRFWATKVCLRESKTSERLLLLFTLFTVDYII